VVVCVCDDDERDCVAYTHASECVCVCACERKRGQERRFMCVGVCVCDDDVRACDTYTTHECVYVCVREVFSTIMTGEILSRTHTCVCVCVCARGRESKRERVCGGVRVCAVMTCETMSQTYT